MEDRVTAAGRVSVLPDAAALADAAAALIAEQLRHAMAIRGRVVLALSGGSTPRATHERLAERTDVDWSRAHVVWGDERCVPPDDPASNYRMARETLLGRVPIPPAQVHRICGEAPPHAEAARYDAVLRALVGDGVIDLVLLGLGADGHTASLFPDEPPSLDDDTWVRAVSFADARGGRITLTQTPLAAATTVTFLVTGADKAPAVAAALMEPEPMMPLPARRIARGARDVRWLLDRAAAGALGT